MPSFILIHPTVWPQYTNVTDGQDRTGQTDRQQSHSIGQTVLPGTFLFRKKTLSILTVVTFVAAVDAVTYS